MMIKPKKKLLMKKITGEQDFPTLEEYRSYLISTLTCLQQQSPVLQLKKPQFKKSTPVQVRRRTPVVKTRISKQEQLKKDADEFQFWLVNDSSVPPSLLDLGLQNYLDAERPNYYQRQSKNKDELVSNTPHSSLNNLRVENAMVDELFNFQECEESICDPDEDLLLFPNTSKTEESDDITTMKFLIKYKMNVGPLPFSVHEPEPTQIQLDCLHAYIQALIIRYGIYISGVRLRNKILKLHNKYKNLVEGQGGKPNAQRFSTRLQKIMIYLLKKTWEQQDQEAGANLGR